MLEEKKKPKGSSSAPIVPILIGIVAVAAVAGLLVYVQQAGQGSTEVVLTDEARAYLPNLDLSNVNMEANEDALGQTLLEITGEITNLGQRTLTVVEANCVFRNIDRVEIVRQRSAFVHSRTGTLEPGETQSFRMAFDNVPLDWNQILPDLYIAQIQFEE